MRRTEDRFERRQERLRLIAKVVAIVAVLGLAGSLLVNYSMATFI